MPGANCLVQPSCEERGIFDARDESERSKDFPQKSADFPETGGGRLSVRLRLAQSDDLVAGFELTPLFEKLNALETFQNVALCGNGADAFEAAML